jgi:hypothetical protein
VTEDEFEAVNDLVIAVGTALADRLDDQEVLLLAQEYARVYAQQAIARAAMQQHRAGRYSLAAQITEGAR